MDKPISKEPATTSTWTAIKADVDKAAWYRPGADVRITRHGGIAPFQRIVTYAYLAQQAELETA